MGWDEILSLYSGYNRPHSSFFDTLIILYLLLTNSMLLNKRQIIPKQQSKKDNSEKLAQQGTQDKGNTTKKTKHNKCWDTTMHKQTQIT